MRAKRLHPLAYFPSLPSTSTPGTLIIQSGAMVLDLYRALNPVVAVSRLSQPVMQISNDYHCLSGEMAHMNEGLEECKNDLEVLSDSWFIKALCVGSMFLSTRFNIETNKWRLWRRMF